MTARRITPSIRTVAVAELLLGATANAARGPCPANKLVKLQPDECDCPGDLDHDWDIDLVDLAQLPSNYGVTSGAAYEDGDIDFDGDVDLCDLAALLSVYGTTCK